MQIDRPRVVVMSQYANGIQGLVEGCAEAGVEPLAAIGVRARGAASSRRSPARSAQVKAMISRVALTVPVIAAGALESAVGMLHALKPDLVMVRGFPWKLPASALLAPRLGVINIHPSPLPRYRGAYPVHYAVMENDPVLTATAHWMVEDYDAGNILAKRTVALPEETFGEAVWKLVDEVTACVVPPALSAGLQGQVGKVQASAEATLADSRPLQPHGQVVNTSAIRRRSVHGLIRAASLDGAKGVLLSDGEQYVLARRSSLAEPPVSKLIMKCSDGPIFLSDYEFKEES